MGDRNRVISQANNLYTFPGIGLGTIAVRARGVTDPMLLAAARTLAGLVSAERLAEGALYPPLAGLRAISRGGRGRRRPRGPAVRAGPMAPRQEPEAAVDAAMWTPNCWPGGRAAGWASASRIGRRSGGAGRPRRRRAPEAAPG